MLGYISNTVIKTYLSQRFKRIERIRNHTPLLQQKVLQNLIQYSKDTEWGKANELNKLSKVQELSDTLPISTYESIQPYIERMMHGEENVLTPSLTKYFAKSAGTTSGKSKYLPINRQLLHHNLIASSWESMAIYALICTVG